MTVRVASNEDDDLNLIQLKRSYLRFRAEENLPNIRLVVTILAPLVTVLSALFVAMPMVGTFTKSHMIIYVLIAATLWLAVAAFRFIPFVKSRPEEFATALVIIDLIGAFLAPALLADDSVS